MHALHTCNLSMCTDDIDGLTDEELSAGGTVPLRTVLLSETPTIMLLEVRGSAVATDFRDYDKYQKEKAEYERRKARQVTDMFNLLKFDEKYQSLCH
jgi:hypothetical protein